MTDVVTRAANPDHDVTVNRDLLAQMDEAATSGEHWKILLTSSMGFFTDAYDLFIIGVVATMIPGSAVTLGVAESRGTRPPAA